MPSTYRLFAISLILVATFAAFIPPAFAEPPAQASPVAAVDGINHEALDAIEKSRAQGEGRKMAGLTLFAFSALNFAGAIAGGIWWHGEAQSVGYCDCGIAAGLTLG